MKLAIMQPYFFPYIGYFQLIHSVDKFVIYNDTQFVKRGWYNRNRIFLNGKYHYFTVPCKRSSQKTLISDIKLSGELYLIWKDKFLKTLHFLYKKQEQFNDSLSLIESILEKNYDSLSDLNYQCIKKISEYLDINTILVKDSFRYNNRDLKGEKRILDICRIENITTYINLIGGLELYSFADFKKDGVDLQFIKTIKHEYPQGLGNEFISHLSIIDLLMCNPKDVVIDILNKYILIGGNYS